MDFFLKAAIPATVLLIAGLLVIMTLAVPVQRSSFRVEPADLDQKRLVEELRDLEGVFGLRLEAESGRLLVDHCPTLEPLRLAEILAALQGVGPFAETKRILSIQALAFPPEPGGVLTAGRGCRPDSSCHASSSWKELLDRWRGS